MNVPLPALDWLKRYDRNWLRGDLVAGITLAAYLLPAGLGDASLANLPPQAGLYACLFGGLVFWLFCSSRHTAITVTSAISLLVGASLGEIAGGDTSRFSALAAGTALLVALIAFIAWLVKAGSIVNFISESVMVGFKCGVALFPGQHAVAQVVWHPRCPRQFLGEQRQLPEAPARNQSDLAHNWRRRAGGARARKDLPQEQTRGVVRRGGRYRGFGLARPGSARGEAAGRSAARAAGHRPAGDSLGGLERTAAAGVRVFSARRGGDGRHWPHVHRQTWRAAGRQPGIPRARRVQSRRRIGSRFPDQRRHVAIARQRRRGRAHAALGRLRGGDHFGGGAFLLAPAGRIAAAGAGRSRVGGGGRLVQDFRPQTTLARRSPGIRRRRSRPSSACSGRACCAA